MTLDAEHQGMTKNQNVPAWVAELIERIRERQQDIEMFQLRELADEARDAAQERDAIIRHLARRLREPGL